MALSHIARRSPFGPALPLALAIAAGLAGAAKAEGPSREEIEDLRGRVERLLTTELTTRWYPQALDKVHGGFHQDFARDWTPRPDQNKFLVYQARMTWTAAAFAAFDPARREEYLEYTRHGIEALDRVMRDAEQGGFHFILNARGELDPRLGDEKHVYATSFVVYAAAKAHEVSGDERALKIARDAFDWLERHAHDAEHGGYFEAIRRDGTPITARDDRLPIARRQDRLGIYYGFKSMNSHIHLLEAVAALYRVDRRPLVRERLEELLAIVRDRIAVDPGALNLYLTRGWKAIPAHDSFGHDVETAYLLVEAAEVLGRPEDEPTWRMARLLVDHALDWGWDEQHGGFYDKGDSFAVAAYGTSKVWWTQAEGLNALMVMHRKYGSETDRYWRAFRQQWAFIERHMIDPEHGGWFEETTRQGQLIGDGRKASQWKANYHTSRALMNVAAMLRDLAGERP